MRTDAARNRAAILDATRELIAEPGELKLSAVAKRAGIGQGTLYRHFATRDELVGALYEQEIDELVERAHLLLEQHSPLEALERWFDQLAGYARVKGGVINAVESSVWADISAHTHTKLGRALNELLSAGAAAGVLRTDLDPRDVILLSWFLAHVQPEEWDDRVPRLLDVLLQGMQSTGIRS
ncbi:TetR/AcrR family transcriptional regulator [Microlunatus soli]|uniref:DNA-binding transcriptional regulator, AcrR family n=1 Tax=Microlunatus soli TaxID=630515 RepID=A0A1H1TT07_9ACTN|nr:TetR/AcrR family transcriptional regulator [Microlunatus soli]SDS63056.1 DNA-binding transcriptional regulator, AcrR family [Microlunatus soli]